MATVKSLVKQLTVMTNEEKKKIKEKELYSSSAFSSYIKSLVDGLTGRYGIRNVSVDATYDTKDSEIAFTTGDHIFLNCGNSLVNQYTGMEARFSVNLGVLFHEVGHILFLDFDGEKRMMEAVRKGKFPGTPPVAETAEEEEDLKELEAAMQNPAYAGVFTEVYHEISNTIADPHDEAKMIGTFSYLIERGIVLAREGLIRTATSLENMIDAGISKLSITYSLLLQMARFGTFLAEDPTDAILNSEYTSVLRRCMRNLEAARLTDNTETKFSNINQIVLAMWPSIKEEMLKNQPQQTQQGESGDQSQSGQGSDSQSGAGQSQQSSNDQQQTGSGNQQQSSNGNQQQSGNRQQQSPGGQQQANSNQQSSGSGQQGNKQSSGVPKAPTRKQIEQVLKALEAGEDNAGQTEAPARNHSSKAAQDGNKSDGAKDAGKGNANGQQANKDKQSERQELGDDAMKKALNGILTAIAEEKASKKLDKELCVALNMRINAVNMSSSHKNIPLRVTRNSTVSESDIQAYDSILSDVKDYSKHLQKKMLKELNDLAQGRVFKNRLWGKDINISEAYRPNGRYWIKKTAPDMPSMAVCVLVDNSGSMWGARIASAKRAAVLLYDFCRGLNIPVHIAGHHTDGLSCCYHVCADYDAVGKYDGYRITKMSPDGCNRDGMAIEIAADLLSQRQEQVKLLIVISDGQPNHHKYGGEAAAKDIREIIGKYRRRDVITYAAAIGDDKDNIKAIYGDQFLNISDLSELPKTLVSLVVKYLRH